MPGLYLSGMGGAKATAGTGFSNPSAPVTATQAAFGPGYGGGNPSTSNALFPNDPFGCALWGSIIALGLLLFIRHSLPA
jgi:hypothetical protein